MKIYLLSTVVDVAAILLLLHFNISTAAIIVAILWSIVSYSLGLFAGTERAR